MNIIVTTNDCLKSSGYIETVMRAFKAQNQWAEDVEMVSYARLTCTREGYPVRFAIKNFTLGDYRNVMYGTKESHICTLTPLPVPLTSTLQS